MWFLTTNSPQPVLTKNIVYWVAAVYLLFTTGCDKTISVQSVWNDGRVNVDGRGEDWENVPLDSVEEMKLSWGIRNDGSNLYVLIVSWNDQLIRIFQREGITLWIDSSLGKKKDFGIFVMGGMLRQKKPVVNNSQEKEDESNPENFTAPELAVIYQNQPTPISADGKAGLAVASNCEGLVCAYELRIPLRKSTDAKYALGSDPGTKVLLGIEILVPEERTKRVEVGRNKAGRGLGGRGLGGRGKGSRGQGGLNRNSRIGREKAGRLQLENKEQWLSVSLAKQPKLD